MSEYKNRIQWQPLVELIVVLVTILGSTIPLYLHTDAKMDRMSDKLNSTVEGIREDMRDFHGRLCAIEERSKERK